MASNNTSNPDSDTNEKSSSEFSPDEYRRPVGRAERTVDTADESHALKTELGDKDRRSIKLDPKTVMELVSNRYKDPFASFREYIANAETACIRRLRTSLVDANAVPDEYDSVHDMRVPEMREICRDRGLYNPVIEFYHGAHESDFPAVQIRDNGIGISVEEFRILRTVGLSANHGTGEDLGQFGQGVVSGFSTVGEHGDIICDTYSYLDESCYGFRFRLDGTNDRPGKRDTYGTTFTFPSFKYDLQGTDDVQDKVEEYVEQLRIPVVYEEYDADNDHVAGEEYPATDITERYDSEPIVWEDPNSMVTAVMWPKESGHDGHDTETYLISMPIDRNAGSSSYGRGNKFDSPYHFDLRINYEDGRIVAGDEEHIGDIPLDPRAYESLSSDKRDEYVSKEDVNDTALTLPEPVDDRDRFKSGNDEFYRYVSKKLAEHYYTEFSDELDALAADGIDTLRSLDETRGELFAYVFDDMMVGSNASKKAMSQRLSQHTDVDITNTVSEQLYHACKWSVQLAPRDNGSSVTRQRNRNSMSIIELFSCHLDTDSDVYMSARTIHTYDRVRAIWGAHESNVAIVVKRKQLYDEYTDAFGWQPLKDVSLENVKETFPAIADDVARDIERGDYFDNNSGDSVESDNTPNTKRTYTKRTRPIEIRYADNIGFEATAGNVFDSFPDERHITTLRHSVPPIEHVIVLRETEYDSTSDGLRYSNNPYATKTARTLVPNYVADFLTQKDNFYDGLSEYQSNIVTESIPAIEFDDVEDLVTDDFTPSGLDIDGFDDMHETYATSIVPSDYDGRLAVFHIPSDVNKYNNMFDVDMFEVFISSIPDQIESKTGSRLSTFDIDHVVFTTGSGSKTYDETRLEYHVAGLESVDIALFPQYTEQFTYPDRDRFQTDAERFETDFSRSDCISTIIPSHIFERGSDSRAFLEKSCRRGLNRTTMRDGVHEFLQTISSIETSD